MIKLSPFTFEVKLRYLSVLLIIITWRFVGHISTYFTDLIGIDSFIDSYFAGNEVNSIVIFTIYLVPSTLAWAMFNRWYFMIPTMVILGIVLLFTIVLGIVWSGEIARNPEEYMGYFLSVITESILAVSFAMYLKRTIKNRKVTTTKQ